MYPILLELGPVTIYSFGVLMALGFYVGTLISAREYRRRGYSPDDMWSLLVWAFVSGLVSSKVLSVAADLGQLLRDPVAALASGSGFVWFGGLIGGAAVAWVLALRRKMDFAVVTDCTAIGIPVGHAIGRLGCHVAGDGDWGTITDVPWAVAYTNAFIGWNYPDGVRVHPTPIYESMAYLAIAGLIFSIRRKDLPAGTLFAIYVLLSSIARFLVEFIRINPRVLFGLTQAQVFAIALAASAAVWLVSKRMTPARARAEAR